MPTEKAVNNAKIGKIYFYTIVDSVGHPNGMGRWEDLDTKEQYFYAAQGLVFLQQLFDQNYISYDPRIVGLDTNAKWNIGDCKELFDLLKEKS